MPSATVRPRPSLAPKAADMPPAPPQVWLGATYVLRSTAATVDPYPHICATTVVGRMSHHLVSLNSRDCAACAREGARP